MEFDIGVFLQQLASPDYAKGALLSVGVAVLALVLATAIGFALALGKTSGTRWAQATASAYIWFFRAIPALLVLLIIWNAFPQLFPILRQDWFSPFLAAFVGLGIVEAAFMAEIIRSALLSVDEGQYLAARALGMAPAKVMAKVILPQVVRIALPPTGNEFIGLVKFSSLASVISLQELLTTAQVGVNITFRYAEYYAVAIIYYLAIVTLLTLAQNAVEKKFLWTSRKAPTRPAPAQAEGTATEGAPA
ncbi:amino acid ABC transporter permease [Sinomonas sp. ASV322]|uniref:amino acid ABC transporter permease n=1 Tax=Sinomonas sp. ASV322 TaxID=3041920 RepID=UPI0027DB977A|nr:amino acid ABC transporter permease [Sinomonas sp. ASV322]MDQ4503876.1 amino acid ABC transporter permease [Sinomonas sp. ASV322]